MNTTTSTPIADKPAQITAGTVNETAAQDALYETSADISSALLWLAGGGDLSMSFANASDRIRGAIECLRRHQAERVRVNQETDRLRKETTSQATLA